MSTAAPFRLLIQQNLTAALKEITPTNGYVNDLSDIGGKPRVVRGRALFGEGDPLPLVAILQPPHAVDPIENPTGLMESVGEWVLLIQGWASDDPVNPSDPAEILMADVRKRLAKLPGEGAPPGEASANNILGLGPANPAMQKKNNTVVNLTIGRGVVRPAADRSERANFWLLLMVNIAEDVGNPYSV